MTHARTSKHPEKKDDRISTMPRSRDERVWEQFEKVPDPNSPSSSGQLEKTYVKCKLCEATPTKPNVTRMKSHLRIKHCQILPEDVKVEVDPTVETPLGKRQRKNSPSANRVVMPSPVKKISNSPTREGHDSVDQLIAHALYVTGTPLSFLEHAEWKGVFDKVSNGTYQPPTYQELSGPLLEDAFLKMKERVTTVTTNMLTCTFIYQGFLTRHNNAMCAARLIVAAPTPLCIGEVPLTHVVQDSPPATFVHAVAEQFRLVGIMTYAEMKKVKMDTVPFFTAKVPLMISDSTNIMCCARQMLVDQEIVPFAAGDPCQALSVFSKHVCQLFMGLVERMTKIAGYFHQNPVRIALLESCQVQPSVPSSPILGMSRSNLAGVYQLTRSLLKSRLAVEKFIVAAEGIQSNAMVDNCVHVDVPGNIDMIIRDAIFWEDVTALNTILRFISRLINLVKDEEALPISCTYGIFLVANRHLKNTLPSLLGNLRTTSCFQGLSDDDKGVSTVLQKLEEEYKRIQSPLFELAFSMDPAFSALREKAISETGAVGCFSRIRMRNEIDRAFEKIANGNDVLEAKLDSQLMDVINNGMPSIKLKHRKFHPLTTWQERIACPKELMEVALRIFRLPTSCGTGLQNFKMRSRQPDANVDDKQGFICYNEKQLKHFSSGDTLPFLGPRDSDAWDKIIHWQQEELQFEDESEDGNMSEPFDAVYDPNNVPAAMEIEQDL